ncbi:hypothetical protein CRYUN_Cryun21dG0028600 [Craigia yunnanensis]
MAEASRLVSSSAGNINQIPSSFQSKLNPHKLQSHNVNIRFKAASKRHDYSSLVNKKDCRSSRRRLITISTADGRWHGTWSCDYLVSLRDLNLDDLVEDDHQQNDAQVSINLCIHKVIYVKPGDEANLDSLIQDTIRLTTSTKVMNIKKNYCYIGKRNAASIDKRWCRLLELRNANF